MLHHSYRGLHAWQKAVDLVEHIYRISHEWPREESFGLTSQIRRAAVSVPTNIAEGQGRGSKNEFLRFLHIAKGSLYELETQLLIAQRLRYIDQPTCETLMSQAAEVGKLIHGLIRQLKSVTSSDAPE